MNQLYSISEVATRLNLSEKTLRRWEEAGRFVGNRTLGNQRRYSISDLQILDAIKHGIIERQSDLLTAHQAATLAGVSTSTLVRWDEEGKIFPFITSDGNYYLRPQLLSKLNSVKASAPDPSPVIPTMSQKPEKLNLANYLPQTTNYKQFLFPNSYFLIPLFLLILALYHLFFVRPLLLHPITPQGSVQDITTSNFDPRVDDLIRQFKDSQARYELLLARPTPTPIATESGTIRGL